MAASCAPAAITPKESPATPPAIPRASVTAGASPERARASPPLAANPRRGIWPEIVQRAPPPVREAYEFAAANEAVLRWIPCYCGCVNDGHRDNFECYVAAVRSDGWLALDTHGLG